MDSKNGLWDFYVKECNDKGSIGNIEPSDDECDEPYDKDRKNSCSDSFLNPIWMHKKGMESITLKKAAIRRILGFGIRRIRSLYRPCYKEIDELVTVYSGKRRVLNSYGHSDASSTHFCLRTQIGESSRAKYQGSSSF
ncbi:hypothetical protein Tco_1148094 [Tanacetum coccineum]